MLAAAALLTLLTGVPGWLFTRSLLFAPVAGACLFLPLSIVICSLLGLGVATILLAWLAACAIAWWLRPKDVERPAHAAIVALLVAAAAALPASQAYPTVKHGGLHVAPPIYDHAKVAVVDSIARDGLPPVSPYYADAGAAVPLNYYWGLHFLMAQARVVLGVSGWAADVAGSWLAAAALIVTPLTDNIDEAAPSKMP